MRPIPAETEHERVPTWTRRGCASAAAAVTSIAMPATGAKKDLAIMFLPSAVLKLTTRTRFTHSLENQRLTEISLRGKLRRPGTNAAFRKLIRRYGCVKIEDSLSSAPHMMVTSLFLGDELASGFFFGFLVLRRCFDYFDCASRS